MYQLEEYSTMLKPGSTAVPKMYAVDQGMVYAVSRANQQDIGKRLETAIFCELQRRTSGRRTETITSYTMPTSKQEKVDFLIGDALATEPYGLIQVCANMGNEKTRAREIGSLQAVMQRTNVDSGLILTLNEEKPSNFPIPLARSTYSPPGNGPSTKRDGKVSENAGKEIRKWMMPYRCP